MVVLSGKSLGERQRELNSKVAEVIANKTDFDVIKAADEANDIDKLIKIDVASQYKDIDYIIDILKSGDGFHISRALKCLWLYEDNYSHVINDENLHNNIFPYMSLKMKGKMLSTISMHVRNHDRAASFYKYCKRNQMPLLAMKFLNFTSEEFKLDAIKNKQVTFLDSSIKEHKVLENFIGNSFTLAEASIEHCRIKHNLINNLTFLFSVCNEKYLDILEQHEKVDLVSPNAVKRIGIRISKEIMIKHKSRVLKNPLLYVNKLNKSILLKYSIVEDAKCYIANLMPKEVNDFWNIDFCKRYHYVLDLIPINERFEFTKQLFTTKYPNEDFEMTLNFYNLKYYEMMTLDDRESWALRQIDSQKEILGRGNDYIWYKFVKLDKALLEIKKYIMVTPDNSKRSDMLNILVKSARNQNDLIKLLRYYYERHVNERVHDKQSFIDEVLSVHNAFEFNIECWEALNILFYSLDVYNFKRHFRAYQVVAVACHIIHKKDMPGPLVDFIDHDVNYFYFTFILEKLGKDKSEVVYNYILQLFLEKLKPFEQDPYNKKLREELVKYVYNINNLLSSFHKDDKECPEIVKKFLEIHSPKDKEESKKIFVKDVFRMLKVDAKLSVEVLSELKENYKNCPEKLNILLSKLKVYFENDVAKEYLRFFHNVLSQPSDTNPFYTVSVAVNGILMLEVENELVSFMEKYQPLSPKIDYNPINRNLQDIRSAICKAVAYRRPPVPLENVLKYIKGDYVHDCIMLFSKYLAYLPLPQLFEFAEAIMKEPLSVQKHGLKIAFKCFPIKNLKDVLLKAWKRTKNISLRMILYKSLYNKITHENADAQAELYEVLKVFTSDLHADDHEDLFSLLRSDGLPSRFINDFLQTGWDMVLKLPDKPVSIDRQTILLQSMERKFDLVDRQFIYKRIIEEHINADLKINDNTRLYKAKWDLTAQYIVLYHNSNELEENLELLKLIFNKCVDKWNESRNGKEYIFRKFYFDFVQTIKEKSFLYERVKVVPICQRILDMLVSTFRFTDVYLHVWDLQLTIYALKSLTKSNEEGENFDNMRLFIDEISLKFANSIGNFVKDLSTKQQFYSVFLTDIANLLNRSILTILCILNVETYLEVKFIESLVDLGMKEVNLLSLLILSMDKNVRPEIKEIHTRILKKLREFNNDEVQSFLNARFVVVD